MEIIPCGFDTIVELLNVVKIIPGDECSFDII